MSGEGQDHQNEEEILPTPPSERMEQLTDSERLAVQRDRSIAFNPPANNISIPMLDGAKNWDHWYNTVLGMCEMADIDGIFTGEDSMPIRADNETDKQFNNRSIYWKTANKYIAGSIRSSLRPGGLAHITGVFNAHQMAIKLRSQYNAKGSTSRELLWRTLSRTSLESCKDMTEWVETIKKAKSSLMELESTIPEWIITTTFLHGLPSSYDSFVEIILNSRGKDANGRLLDPDFDEVCGRVIDRERRQKVMASNHNNSKALKASKKGKPLNRPNSNRSGGRNNQRPERSECDGSHGGDCRIAHPEKATQDWQHRNESKIAESKKSKKTAKKEKACCAKNTNIKIKDPGFFFDSAASLHYTYSLGWYQTTPLLLDNPIAVETCDGSVVYVTRKGLIQLDTLITNEDGENEECRLSIKDVHYCPEMNINLLSLGTLVRNGLSFGASKNRLTVTNDDGDTIMEGVMANKLFKLRLRESDDSKALFPRYFRLMPERWYSMPETATDKRAFTPFSIGHFAWMGENLALAEPMFIMELLVGEYDTQVDHERLVAAVLLQLQFHE